jgi:RNA polymerase sigma factor (sigma-70 family)
MVEDYAKQWPSPLAVFSTVHRRMYRCALAMGLGEDDLGQLCWLGVMKAAKGFDPAYGASFATYAASKMYGTVSHWVSGQVRGKRTLPEGSRLFSGDAVNDEGKSNWNWIPGSATTDTNPGDAETIREAVDKVLRRLPERYRRVVEMRWGLAGESELTLEETGDRLGVTRERIRQLEREAMSRIRVPLALAGGPLIGVVTEN